MDNRFIDPDEGEDISDAFTCCVCLELLHKPIVLPCGHVSCFWCVHRSMNSWSESHCPMCRQQYYHFPTICQPLYHLISKMYPTACRRREALILEQEKKDGVFSPQLDAYAVNSQTNKQPELLAEAVHSCDGVCQSNSYPESTMEQSDSVPIVHDYGTTTSRSTSEKGSEPIPTDAEDKCFSQNEDGACRQVLFTDVLCAGCSQLLFHPVVLNCGHVYCETCIVKPPDDVLRCKVCQCPHPYERPKVCLVLNNFLEEQFPEEYKQRKDAVQVEQVNLSNGASNSSSSKTEKHISERWNEYQNMHRGVGCDYCGMCPIIGERYRCKDCKEIIGFDLCGDCYKSCSKLPGRFNQQHTPEHQFKLIPGPRSNRMPRFVIEQLRDSDAVFIISNDEAESLEISIEGPPGSDGAEHPENSEGPVTDSESSEDHQNEMV